MAKIWDCQCRHNPFIPRARGIDGDFIKALNFVILLSILLGMAWAAQLNVTVEDKDGTKLTSTTVQIWQGNALIGEKKADDLGVVRFELPTGTYFAKLIRGGYAEHVMLLAFGNDMKITYVMLIVKPTYTLYGQIIDIPAGRWNGSKLYLVDGNGAKTAETTISGDGYYAMSSLYPGRQYRIKLPTADGGKISSLFRYDGEGAYYLEMDLRDSAVLVDEAPALSAPQKAELYSQINVYLRSANKPLAGKTVRALTPAGEISITTDENGVAKVQAAGEGEYLFEYGNLSMKTVVSALKAPPVAVPEEKKNEQDVPLKVEKPAEQQNPQSFLSKMGGAGIVMLVGGVFGVVLVAAVAYFLTKKKGKEEAKKGGQEAHGHAHEIQGHVREAHAHGKHGHETGGHGHKKK